MQTELIGWAIGDNGGDGPNAVGERGDGFRPDLAIKVLMLRMSLAKYRSGRRNGNQRTPEQVEHSLRRKLNALHHHAAWSK